MESKIKKISQFSKKKAFYIFIALFAFVAGTVMAVPPATTYDPGETLSPNCAPGDINCTVSVDRITSLNGITDESQTFSVGTSGTDFNIDSTGTIHTFNFPDASATARGLLTSADWSLFDSKADSGANSDITSLLGGITSIDFTPASAPAYQEGRLFYDSLKESLSYYSSETGDEINIGRAVSSRFINGTASTVTAGTPVYMTGSVSGIPTVALARADSPATSQVLGVVNHNTDPGAVGHMTQMGALYGLSNLNTFTAGETLYLSPTVAGTLTNSKPSYPYYEMIVGIVAYAPAPNGVMGVSLGPFDKAGGTPGVISFGSSDGFYEEDSSNLFWDDTNNRLGIGTNTPSQTLTVGSGGTPNFFVDGTNGNLTMNGNLTLASSGGTVVSSGGGLSLNSATTYAITLDSGTTGEVNVGTGANAKIVTIGNNTGATTLNLNSGTGGINLQVAGTGTVGKVQIGAGGAGSATPDYLALDVKSTTGDPAGGVEGEMYYNTFDNKFRCYEDTGWEDCISVHTETSLSGLLAASAGNTLSNGDNAQVWNWSLTTADKVGMTFGESVASTASGSPSILKASTLATSTAIPLHVVNLGEGDSFRVDDSSSDSSPFLIDKNGNVAIGADSFDAIAPQRLRVVMSTGSTSYTVFGAEGNVDNYLQMYVQNMNAGENASSDIVASADNGDEESYYIDMGINSSNYNNPDYSIGGPNDGYLYVTGGDLSIGTADVGANLIFHTGGTEDTDERMRIMDDGSGNPLVGIGTTAPGEMLSLGEAGAMKGVLSFAGDTSGKIVVQPASVAGTYTLTLPTDNGDPDQHLASDGSGNLYWADPGGYWQRAGTIISPTVAGDDVTTSGDISTSGSGTITSAGLLTGNTGLTVSGATTSLNDNSNFNTTINTGTSTGMVTIGSSNAGAIQVTSGAGLTLTGGAASNINTTAGNLIFQPAGTGNTANVQIGAGGAGSTTPDLLALDVKSTAGDPAGTNGAMYYNANSNTFRCYVNGSWGDCDTTGGTATLQSAYNTGATITTASSTDLALTLTSGNFTASGAGSVNLTPTGASSFTSGGALTFTAGATSTWGTTAGNLNLQVAGVGTTANIQIGAGGAGSATPDLLALDVKSTAGDPAGINGAMYYSENTDSFRCYVNGGWQECGASAASDTTLQQAYNAGATITTASSTDLALTLTSGNFTASGAGSVNLTPTGASSFTSGGALTFTAGATSTWGTTAGDLSLEAGGNLALVPSGASTGVVQIGTGAGTTTPDVFSLDIKSDAGDPAGSFGNGSMYFNDNLGTFRCRVGGSWVNCGIGTLQEGYENNNTITTADGNAFTLDLDNGGFTTTGSGTISFGNTINIPGFTASKVVFTDASKNLTSTGTVGIDQGGTGQTTKAAAFNALSPITTKGDIIAGNGANSATRLPVGTNGQILSANSGQATGLAWVDNQVPNDSVDFTQMADSMTLDATTFIAMGGFNLNFTNTGGNGAISMIPGGVVTITAGAASTWGTSAGALTLQAAGTGTSDIQIGAGGAGSTTPDLFALDVKSDAGDPTGAAGKMYYNANSNKFRCYENSSWKDCDTTGGSITLQTAFDNGQSINLGSNNLTINADSTGDILLQDGSTDRIAIIDDGTLTITAGASSTWSTSSGALSIDSAAGFNLGTVNATDISIGASGIDTTINGPLIASEYIDITNSSSPSYFEGRLFYDNTDKTLAYYNDASGVNVNIGQESLVRVKNNTGSQIDNGKVVYINGTDSGVPTVALAQADSLATSRVVGIMTADIPNSSIGYAISFGLVHNLSTGGFSAGDEIYLSASSAGDFTTTKPSAPNYVVSLGYVVVSDGSAGIVLSNMVPSDVGSMTAGSVRFTGTDGLAAQDNTNFFWDNTNKRLGILDNTPAAALSVGSGDLFTVTSTGAITTSNDAAINGGDITTTAATGNIFNTNATTLNFGGAATTLNIGPTGSGAGSILFAGGSSDTGCTINEATGALTCSGAITTTATSGNNGWWNRTGTTISPVTAGDAITTSGNISTSGAGTITSAGLLTGSANLEVTGSWKGNVVTINTSDSNTTSTISTAAMAYYVSSTDTNGSCATSSKTFNITGLSSTEGQYAYIVSKAIDGGCTSNTLTLTVSINGTTISTVVNANTDGTVTENYIVAYINGAWRILGTPSTADGADLAEAYSTNDDTIEAGEVVSIDPLLEFGVKKSEGKNDKNVIGIVSTTPAMVIGKINESEVTSVPVALSGRVPVKVNTENGPIVAGDYLSPSSVPGIAMKSNGAGPVIGQAMSGYSEDEVGLVLAFVKNFDLGVETVLFGDIFNIDGLTTLITDIQAEIARNPITIISEKISAGTQFLTDFVVARVTAIRGYFDEIFTNTIHQKILCIGEEGDETCITKTQLDELLSNANVYNTINDDTGGGTSSDDTSDTSDTESDTSGDVGDDTGGDITSDDTTTDDTTNDTAEDSTIVDGGSESGDTGDDTSDTDAGSDTNDSSSNTSDDGGGSDGGDPDMTP